MGISEMYSAARAVKTVTQKQIARPKGRKKNANDGIKHPFDVFLPGYSEAMTAVRSFGKTFGKIAENFLVRGFGGALKDIDEARAAILDKSCTHEDFYQKHFAILIKYGAIEQLENIAKNTSDGKHCIYSRRAMAINAMENLKNPLAVPTLLNLLYDKNKNPKVEAAAALALGTIGDQSAVDPLIARANVKRSKYEDGRFAAVKALGWIGGKKANSFVIKSIEWTKDAMYLDKIKAFDQAHEALKSSTSPTVVKNLVLYFYHQHSGYNPKEKRAYTQRMKKIVPTLIKVLGLRPHLFQRMLNKDPFMWGRHYAAATLGKIDDRRAMNPLCETIEKDRNKYVVGAAIDAVYNFYSPRILRAVLGAMDKSGDGLYNNIRLEAMEYLMRYIDKVENKKLLVQKLKLALKDNSDRKHAVCNKAVAFLAKLKAHSTIPNIIEAMFDPKTCESFGEIAEALGNMGDKTALPSLITQLKTRSSGKISWYYGPKALTKVAIAIYKLGGLKALDKILEDVSSSKAHPFVMAAYGISKKPAALKILLRKLKDYDRDIRKAAVEALVHFNKSSQARRSLIGMLTGDLKVFEFDAKVRREAAYSLRMFKHPDAKAARIKASKSDADKSVRDYAQL